MPDYSLFGGTLRSAIDLPELAPATDPPRWTLNRMNALPTLSGLVPVGREDVDIGVTVTLFQAGGDDRLVFDDTGTFDISRDGRQIDWTPPAAPDMDAVRKDVLGRVFAVALDREGVISLHGSAVALGESAVAFLAPKFHGKSTTATALINAGGQLLADDLVPVTPGAVPMVLPSVPVVQLWGDSAAQVAGRPSPGSRAEGVPKHQLSWRGTERNATAAVPLTAVYLLAPVRPDAPEGVRRIRVTGVEAALALLGQAKVGALLGVERRSALLQRLVDLAGQVPVYRLEIPRDFERIGELTNSLWAWHSARSAPTSGGELA